MLCCESLEILNAFSFELVFCTWSPLGQWNMCMNRGYMHVYHSLPLYSHIASMMPPRLRILVGPWSTEVQQDPEYVQGKHAASTREWGEGGDHTQHQETMLSVQTRTCFWHRKKKNKKKNNGILRNTNEQGTLLCPFPSSCVTCLHLSLTYAKK